MSNQSDQRLTGILEKVAISALFLIVTWQYNSISKLEDRMFNMQGEMFTESKAKVMEERMGGRIDAAISNVNVKIDIMTNLLERYMNTNK